MVNEWLTSTEAARRLGVKAETLYAYVSRGVLRSERVPGDRRSRYLRSDVERLAARQRAGGRAGALEITVESQLTHIDAAGRLFYRGWDVERAAHDATFEDVAGWLWTSDRAGVKFEAPTALVRAARRTVRTLPNVPTIDHLRVGVAAMRTADPLRDDRRAVAVAAAGRGMIATLLDVLPLAAGALPPGGPSVAERLWPRLSAQPASAQNTRLLDATLILLADHELAASTLAARVAASTWADPYLVVQAGLAALGGPLHGGASEAAREVVREIRDGHVSVEEAIGSRLRTDATLPGFGHSVYVGGDPRARVLLAMLERDRLPGMRAARHILATVNRRGLPLPNIDFALAALAESRAMIPGAGEVVFAFARIVGWLAHGIEEYRHRLRFRPRAVYTGPPPSSMT